MMRRVLSIPKTLYVNLRCFSLKEAIKLRVRVAYDIKIRRLHRNCIVFEDPKGTVSFGFGEPSFNQGRGGYLNFGPNGQMIVADNAYISKGSKINVNGKLSLGKRFGCNANLLISCEKDITIEDNVTIGWGVTILDSDGHDIMIGDRKTNEPRSVIIGSHCWICSEATILKGTELAPDTVVGFGATVSGKFLEPNTLVANKTAQVLRHEIKWKK